MKHLEDFPSAKPLDWRQHFSIPRGNFDLRVLITRKDHKYSEIEVWITSPDYWHFLRRAKAALEATPTNSVPRIREVLGSSIEDLTLASASFSVADPDAFAGEVLGGAISPHEEVHSVQYPYVDEERFMSFLQLMSETLMSPALSCEAVLPARLISNNLVMFDPFWPALFFAMLDDVNQTERVRQVIEAYIKVQSDYDKIKDLALSICST